MMMMMQAHNNVNLIKYLLKIFLSNLHSVEKAHWEQKSWLDGSAIVYIHINLGFLHVVAFVMNKMSVATTIETVAWAPRVMI